MLYKICDAPFWQTLQRNGHTLGSSDDVRDGYIHLSTAAQVAGTFAKYFRSQFDAGEPLWLLEIAPESLAGEALKYERSRDGALFPHWYGVLHLAQISQATEILLPPISAC
jgi:uncharacterized protein (DUF952 family)